MELFLQRVALSCREFASCYWGMINRMRILINFARYRWYFQFLVTLIADIVRWAHICGKLCHRIYIRKRFALYPFMHMIFTKHYGTTRYVGSKIKNVYCWICLLKVLKILSDVAFQRSRGRQSSEKSFGKSDHRFARLWFGLSIEYQ